MGPIFDYIYPETLNITNNMVNKTYMSHAFTQNNLNKEELNEIIFDEQIILTYCDKSRVPQVGYEIVMLILNQNQKINIQNFKTKLLNFSQSIIKKTKIERIKYIEENLDIFFKKTTEKKILLLGRAGTGKSSIKEIIFEGKNPKELIYNPLEPTRGISPSIYSWLDLKLGLFDTSGQELDFLLKDKNEQTLAFENTDLIIYILDFSMWVVHKNNILDEIKEILNIIENKSFKANLVIFFHKIDLINFTSRDEEISEISDFFKKAFDLPVYFTSIYPELIYNTYSAFYEILSNFSEETITLKNFLEEALKDQSKTMFYVTNKNQSIITQSMTQDFNIKLINHVHKLTAQLNQTFEDMCLNDNIEHLTLTSSKKLKIFMRYLNLSEFDIMNLICVSENLQLEQLYSLTSLLKLKFSNYHYKLKKK